MHERALSFSLGYPFLREEKEGTLLVSEVCSFGQLFRLEYGGNVPQASHVGERLVDSVLVAIVRKAALERNLAILAPWAIFEDEPTTRPYLFHPDTLLHVHDGSNATKAHLLGCFLPFRLSRSFVV